MDNDASNQPDSEFIKSILASLKYWQQQTQNLQPDQVKKLDTKRRNLHTAVEFGLGQPETWEDTARVLLQAFNFAEWRGYRQEWVATLQQALAKAPEKETVLYGRLQNELGQLYRLSHKFPQALAQHQQALALSERLADQELKAITYQNLCEAHLRSNQYLAAEKYGLLALQTVQTLSGQERLQAFVLISLGGVAHFKGDLTTAETYLRQAVTLRRGLNDPVYLARSLNDLANSLIAQNKFQEGQQAFEEALAELEPTTNVIDKARIWLNLGVLFYRQERWAEAEKSFVKIDQLALQVQNDFALLGSVRNNLGNVYLKQQLYAEASRSLEQAIDVWRTLENELELANSLGTLAEVQVERGQAREARTLYQESLALLSSYPDSAWGQKLAGEFEAALAQLPN